MGLPGEPARTAHGGVVGCQGGVEPTVEREGEEESEPENEQENGSTGARRVRERGPMEREWLDHRRTALCTQPSRRQQRDRRVWGRGVVVEEEEQEGNASRAAGWRGDRSSIRAIDCRT